MLFTFSSPCMHLFIIISFLCFFSIFSLIRIFSIFFHFILHISSSLYNFIYLSFTLYIFEKFSFPYKLKRAQCKMVLNFKSSWICRLPSLPFSSSLSSFSLFSSLSPSSISPLLLSSFYFPSFFLYLPLLLF